MSETCIMLVAAEASGDALGASLAEALRRRVGGGIRFVGVGGPRMAAQGVASPFDINPLSVLGVFDALRAWPLVLRRARQTAQIAAKERPDAVVLIDSWGFTLRVARHLRRLDLKLPLIKYVAPQVWATRPGRARTLARAVDHLLTIHGFDAPWFEREGLPVTFVGNPVLERAVALTDPAPLLSAMGAGPGDPILLVLPGSRPGEVDRLMAPFASAIDRLKRARPDLRVVVAAAESVAQSVKAHLSAWPHGVHLVEGEPARFQAMRAATVSLACSGTVTTELALAGSPMVVAYRLGPLTHAVVKRLIQTRYITLLNVAAQDFVVPELVQDRCNGRDLARHVGRLLDDPRLCREQVARQMAALEIMRGGIDDPAGEAAEAVLAVLEKSRTRQSLMTPLGV